MNLIIIAFGLIWGSFLNVVIHRLPIGHSVVKPPSSCPHCGRKIRPWENIPLLSYLLLRGKCNSCGTKIHWRYPLVEFITAFLFWVSWNGVDFASLGSIVTQVRLWAFIAISIAITFIDLDHRIIPDELSLGGWAFGLATAFWDFRHPWSTLWIASFIGFGAFYLFALIYEKLTGRVGLGGGDIKFMGTIGVFLGLGGVWAAILISSILGSVVGLTVAAYQKRKAKDEGAGVFKFSIPYGPFLAVGALVELFFEVSAWMSP
ncbi:MAG: prepilin peptidase [Bdellovibrionales bacterium]|nr:prepilin peptidase [Bdellovibrionales bacterium]